MTEAAGGGSSSSSSSSSASRRTPVIRLHGAPTLSPRQAPKKGGRRASEFYFREPEYLAPPRSTVSTPPPGRKRSASLPHVRSPSPVPPPLARAARAHHVTQQHGRAKGEDDEEDEDEEEELKKADREEDEEGAEDAENLPQQQQHEQQPQHRSRLLGSTAASTDRRKSSPCQPRFAPVRRGRPSLDLSAGHITLGSHLDSEIARRRHSVTVTPACTADKTATSTHDANQRFGASDRVNVPPGHESWLEEASSSDDDFPADAKPAMVKPNASAGVSAATGNGSSRRPVS